MCFLNVLCPRESTSTRKARTIKVKNLPDNTQEALLQQTMEKYGKVTKVEVFKKTNEALVEFENPHVSLIWSF